MTQPLMFRAICARGVDLPWHSQRLAACQGVITEVGIA
jgi:hypothetical protein